jgi:hypothetical protein
MRLRLRFSSFQKGSCKSKHKHKRLGIKAKAIEDIWSRREAQTVDA